MLLDVVAPAMDPRTPHHSHGIGNEGKLQADGGASLYRIRPDSSYKVAWSSLGLVHPGVASDREEHGDIHVQI